MNGSSKCLTTHRDYRITVTEIRAVPGYDRIQELKTTQGTFVTVNEGKYKVGSNVYARKYFRANGSLKTRKFGESVSEGVIYSKSGEMDNDNTVKSVALKSQNGVIGMLSSYPVTFADVQALSNGLVSFVSAVQKGSSTKLEMVSTLSKQENPKLTNDLLIEAFSSFAASHNDEDVSNNLSELFKEERGKHLIGMAWATSQIAPLCDQLEHYDAIVAEMERSVNRNVTDAVAHTVGLLKELIAMNLNAEKALLNIRELESDDPVLAQVSQAAYDDAQVKITQLVEKAREEVESLILVYKHMASVSNMKVRQSTFEASGEVYSGIDRLHAMMVTSQLNIDQNVTTANYLRGIAEVMEASIAAMYEAAATLPQTVEPEMLAIESQPDVQKERKGIRGFFKR